MDSLSNIDIIQEVQGKSNLFLIESIKLYSYSTSAWIVTVNFAWVVRFASHMPINYNPLVLHDLHRNHKIVLEKHFVF